MKQHVAVPSRKYPEHRKCRYCGGFLTAWPPLSDRCPVGFFGRAMYWLVGHWT